MLSKSGFVGFAPQEVQILLPHKICIAVQRTLAAAVEGTDEGRFRVIAQLAEGPL